MYRPLELARFALSEFERGLEGITDEEARTRLTKADGSQMNAISWIIGHIAWQWLSLRSYATLEPRPNGLRPFAFGPTADPTPPPLSDVLKLFHQAKTSIDWIARADDELLVTTREGIWVESVGTFLMRTVLHTWFHAGEVNAIRQMLGHPEIAFVGEMIGNLEWCSA